MLLTETTRVASNILHRRSDDLCQTTSSAAHTVSSTISVRALPAPGPARTHTLDCGGALTTFVCSGDRAPNSVPCCSRRGRGLLMLLFASSPLSFVTVRAAAFAVYNAFWLGRMLQLEAAPSGASEAHRCCFRGFSRYNGGAPPSSAGTDTQLHGGLALSVAMWCFRG